MCFVISLVICPFSFNLLLSLSLAVSVSACYVAGTFVSAFTLVHVIVLFQQLIHDIKVLLDLVGCRVDISESESESPEYDARLLEGMPPVNGLTGCFNRLLAMFIVISSSNFDSSAEHKVLVYNIIHETLY